MSKTVENLLRAQEAVAAKSAQVREGRWRPRFHFAPPCGWMNDPNGCVFFRGRYHIFYQFNPYAPVWGTMHWGHAVSDDLIHWEHLPVALAPGETYDGTVPEPGGCFSGTAIVHEDRLYLFYTGVSKRESGDGETTYVQTQCMAWSDDGVVFTKYEGNPVLTAPEGFPESDFRDPKVWRHGDAFYMLCGAKRGAYGCVLLFRSDDLLQWRFVNVMAQSRGEWGSMWECPDFFELDGEEVLLFSPIGVGARKATYMTGHLDYETGRFLCRTNGEVDWGMDFYAPQTLLDGAGRRIVFGWANAWQWMPWWRTWEPTPQEGWCGSFALPRELRVMDGRLRIVPVRELERLRTRRLLPEKCVEDVADTPLVLPEAECFELRARLDLRRTSASRVDLLLRAGGERATVVSLDLRRWELTVDRSRADEWSGGSCSNLLALCDKNFLDVHLFVDRNLIEVFADEYTQACSCCIYPEREQRGNLIEAAGGVAVFERLEMWELAGEGR